MGIQSLTTFLKTKAPEYIKPIDISFCKKIALDGNQWMTSMLKLKFKDYLESLENPMQELTDKDDSYIRKEWLKEGIRFSLKWIELGITPVWVIDGKAPESKQAQKQKRQASRDSALARYNDLKTKLEITPQVTDQEGVWVADDLKKMTQEDKKKIISYRQQEKSLTPLWIHELKKLFSDIGIPWIQALDEGERCCCMLYHDGLVDAVFSTDTDNLAYGCFKTIQSFNVETRMIQGSMVRFMPYYDLNYILNSLNLSLDEFVDFAIVSGTDFNEGIPKVGCVRALELIHQYKAIKSFPESHKKIKLDVSLLNEDECKRLFTKCPSRSIIKDSSNNPDLLINLDLLKNSEEKLKSYFGPSSARWMIRDIERVIV